MPGAGQPIPGSMAERVTDVIAAAEGRPVLRADILELFVPSRRPDVGSTLWRLVKEGRLAMREGGYVLGIGGATKERLRPLIGGVPELPEMVVLHLNAIVARAQQLRRNKRPQSAIELLEAAARRVPAPHAAAGMLALADLCRAHPKLDLTP